MSTRKKDPTCSRVYGGDPSLVHIADGQRRKVGAWLAGQLDERMRFDAMRDGSRLPLEATAQDLCPGCFMVAVLNAAVTLAVCNGQSVRELSRTLSAAFKHIADDPSAPDIESITVLLDP
jgi:hypothetical protein